MNDKSVRAQKHEEEDRKSKKYNKTKSSWNHEESVCYCRSGDG